MIMLCKAVPLPNSAGQARGSQHHTLLTDMDINDGYYYVFDKPGKEEPKL